MQTVCFFSAERRRRRRRLHGCTVLPVLSTKALPGQTVCCAYDLDWSSRRRNKPHGQAVPGSESGAAAVRGVKFRSLVRGGAPPARRPPPRRRRAPRARACTVQICIIPES